MCVYQVDTINRHQLHSYVLYTHTHTPCNTNGNYIFLRGITCFGCKILLTQKRVREDCSTFCVVYFVDLSNVMFPSLKKKTFKSIQLPTYLSRVGLKNFIHYHNKNTREKNVANYSVWDLHGLDFSANKFDEKLLLNWTIGEVCSNQRCTLITYKAPCDLLNDGPTCQTFLNLAFNKLK